MGRNASALGRRSYDVLACKHAAAWHRRAWGAPLTPGRRRLRRCQRWPTSASPCSQTRRGCAWLSPASPPPRRLCAGEQQQRGNQASTTGSPSCREAPAAVDDSQSGARRPTCAEGAAGCLHFLRADHSAALHVEGGGARALRALQREEQRAMAGRAAAVLRCALFAGCRVLSCPRGWLTSMAISSARPNTLHPPHASAGGARRGTSGHA